MPRKLAELIDVGNYTLISKSDDITHLKSNRSVNIIVPASIVSIDDINQDAVASALIKNKFFDEVEKNKQRDLLYIAWKYVHVGGNKNKDYFTKEELQKADKTPIYKPLNWLHGEPNIGVIYDSMYVHGKDGEPDYLAVYSAIWKFKYKAFAEEILRRNSINDLYVSMETWFTGITCSECGEHFAAVDEVHGNVCQHLMNRMQEGSKTYRVLGDICFGGGGVVDDPADVLASRLAVASKEKHVKGGDSIMGEAEKKYTQEELDSKVQEAIAAAIEEYKKGNEIEKTIAQKETEINTFKMQIEELTKANEKLTSERDGVKKEFDTYKQTEADKVRLQSRVDQLVTKGFKFPDEEDKENRDKVLNTIASMGEEVFAMFVENIQAKASDGSADGESNMAHASVRIPNGAGKPSTGFEWQKGLDEILDRLS